MMHYTNKARTLRGQAAFTLLEIILAVTMLALVVVAVYGTWNVALKAWKRGTDISETFQRQRIVLDTLSELAKSISYFHSQADLYVVDGVHGQNGDDSVSFVTASDVLLPQSESLATGMRRVTISMQRDSRGAPYLAIINEPALGVQDDPSAQTLHVLSADVTGFYVRYRNPRDGTWTEEWAESSYVPSAMEFTLVFGGRDASTPPVVVTRAVELPAALFAGGLPQIPGMGTTTNEVKRRDDIDVGALLRQQEEAQSGTGGDY
jgi:type II secretory pathway pseudopilin PulG